MQWFKRSAIGLSVAVLGLVAATALVPQKTSAAGSGCVSYTYAQGGYSTCIGYIQRMVNGVNNTQGGTNWSILSVDNSFGPATNSAVRAYQSYSGLAVDGRVGPNTWMELCVDSWEGWVFHGYLDAYQAGSLANCSSIYPSY
jgi:peptidoglycan hydrolase-like protein with peptidoglycan-binding domain